MPFLAFFTTALGRYVIVGVVALTVLGGTYMKGRSDGSAYVQAKWDSAVQAAISRGERARTDAESDPRGLSNDQLNRD